MPGRTTSEPLPDLQRDYFLYPDKRTWSLPKSWDLASKAAAWYQQPLFKLIAYRALRQSGDKWQDEGGLKQTYELHSDHQVVDIAINQVEIPRRQRPQLRNTRSLKVAAGGHFLERRRLASVLDAMMHGRPLPPVLLEIQQHGRPKVANGFHRYYASLILGFKELPVEVAKWFEPKESKKSSKEMQNVAKPKWISPSMQRRLDEEVAQKAAAREDARKLRRMEGSGLGDSGLYSAQLAKMKPVKAKAATNWSSVVSKGGSTSTSGLPASSRGWRPKQ